MTLDWTELQKRAIKKLLGLNKSKEYKNRLLFEFKEIDKQGARDYWINLVVENKQFDHNKNGLVLPWLLGITNIDPIEADIKHNIVYQLDFPDIDIDFLPDAKTPVREYAAKRFGEQNVCAVGAWQKYGPKLALVDVARAIGIEQSEILAFTTQLPKEFDEITKFEDVCKDEDLKQYKIEEFAKQYDAVELEDGTTINLFEMAYRMVGKIKTQLRHAGGLIISKVPVRDYIPLTRRDGVVTSEWTEGSNTQLSKFGLVKFDILGLKNLLYIHNACQKIHENHAVLLDWSDMDPEVQRAGWEITDGVKTAIKFDDEKVIKAADSVKVDSIFQFETDLAKSIIQKGGVKSFNDLLVYCALGHPGPLPQVDEYIARRDGRSDWQPDHDNEKINKILAETYNIIVYQEQLTSMWTKLAGFTAPEAEAARKAVAKKWVDQLKPVEEKWIRGSSRIIGEAEARQWWNKMVTFGRYCFNVSHAKAYVIIAYRCLWLKTHYPAEWWSSVMSDCHTDKLTKYMSAARVEGVKFGMMDCDELTENFTATPGGAITPGVAAIKGVGKSVVKKILDDKIDKFDDVFHFMKILGKGPINSKGKVVKEAGKTPVSRTVLEKLIKLGAFRNKCENNKAEWIWYLYNVGKGKNMTALRRLIKAIWCNWTIDEIEDERTRKAYEYRRINPTIKKMPHYIKSWLPENPKSNKNPKLNTLKDLITIANPNKIKKSDPDRITINITDDKFFNIVATNINTLEVSDKHEDINISRKMLIERDHIIQLFDADYTISEKLAFEKEYLGFYWNSPMDRFNHRGQTIERAKQRGILECVIEGCEVRQTKKNDPFYKLTVTDGTEFATVMVWNDTICDSGSSSDDLGVFNIDNGVLMKVTWNDNYRSFNIKKNSQVIKLESI